MSYRAITAHEECERIDQLSDSLMTNQLHAIQRMHEAESQVSNGKADTRDKSRLTMSDAIACQHPVHLSVELQESDSVQVDIPILSIEVSFLSLGIRVCGQCMGEAVCRRPTILV